MTGTQLRGSILYHSCVCVLTLSLYCSTTNHTARKPSPQHHHHHHAFPQKRAIRGPGRRCRGWRLRPEGMYYARRRYLTRVAASPGSCVGVSTLSPPPLPAVEPACATPRSLLSHTLHHHHFPSHLITQGMFNNLYAQATSYGKWARSHSKTVRD